MDEKELEELSEIVDTRTMSEKVKDWFGNCKTWFKEHPDVGLTLLGGVLSIAGAAVKIIGDRKEYDDNMFIVDSNDDIYRIPAKKMKTVKNNYSKEEVEKDFD